jgi:hypothetical protein
MDPVALTDTQLYILIGVPLVFNFGIVITIFVIVNTSINMQFTCFRAEIQARFDALHYSKLISKQGD